MLGGRDRGRTARHHALEVVLPRHHGVAHALRGGVAGKWRQDAENAASIE
jgi:hypothetical protein